MQPWGETLSPSPPFPRKPAPLVPLRMEKGWRVTFWDRRACQKKLDAARWSPSRGPSSVDVGLCRHRIARRPGSFRRMWEAAKVVEIAKGTSSAKCRSGPPGTLAMIAVPVMTKNGCTM